MADAVNHEASALARASIMRTCASKGGRHACGHARGVAVLFVGRVGRARATDVLYAGLRRGVNTRASYLVGFTRTCGGCSGRCGGRPLGAVVNWVLAIIFSGWDFVCCWGGRAQATAWALALATS